MTLYLIADDEANARRIVEIDDRCFSTPEEIVKAKADMTEQFFQMHNAKCDCFYVHEAVYSSLTKMIFSEHLIMYDLNKWRLNENPEAVILEQVQLPPVVIIQLHRAYCRRLEVSEYQWAEDEIIVPLAVGLVKELNNWINTIFTLLSEVDDPEKWVEVIKNNIQFYTAIDIRASEAISEFMERMLTVQEEQRNKLSEETSSKENAFMLAAIDHFGGIEEAQEVLGNAEETLSEEMKVSLMEKWAEDPAWKTAN